MSMDANMDAIYTRIKSEVKRINPLGYVLQKEVLISLVSEYNVLGITIEQKQSMKRQYYKWCRIHHPDKAHKDVEDSIYIYKVYGDAFLRYQEEQYDNVWLFMGYSTVTFHEIIFSELSIPQISRLMRDCDVLCNIARTCTDISTNADIIEKLKNDLKLVKLYVNARDRGHCTKHLAFDNTVDKTDCVQCLAEDEGGGRGGGGSLNICGST